MRWKEIQFYAQKRHSNWIAVLSCLFCPGPVFLSCPSPLHQFSWIRPCVACLVLSPGAILSSCLPTQPLWGSLSTTCQLKTRTCSTRLTQAKSLFQHSPTALNSALTFHFSLHLNVIKKCIGLVEATVMISSHFHFTNVACIQMTGSVIMLLVIGYTQESAHICLMEHFISLYVYL